MGSINWIGRPALGVLTLSFVGSTALAQENAGAMERFLADARAENPRRDKARDPISGGAPLRRSAKSGSLNWGSGGFELRGERLKWGNRSTDTIRLGSRWQRTYAADVSFWEGATPGIAFEAGARLERTKSGVVGGPLLTNPTKTVAKKVYIGAQISDSSSIRLVAFDNGGWFEGETGEVVSRIANGEPVAREGAAMEIGRLEFRSGNDRWEPQLKLRLERGRIAARSNTSATISCRVRL